MHIKMIFIFTQHSILSDEIYLQRYSICVSKLTGEFKAHKALEIFKAISVLQRRNLQGQDGKSQKCVVTSFHTCRLHIAAIFLYVTYYRHRTVVDEKNQSWHRNNGSRFTLIDEDSCATEPCQSSRLPLTILNYRCSNQSRYCVSV